MSFDTIKPVIRTYAIYNLAAFHMSSNPKHGRIIQRPCDFSPTLSPHSPSGRIVTILGFVCVPVLK